MLQRNTHTWQRPRWQTALAQAIRDPRELLQLLELPIELLAGAEAAGRTFPLRVPRAYVSRMRKGDPRDPLLRQVLPLAAETDEVPGYHADPVGDLAAMATPGVLHKYHGRVLLVTTGACGVHCRYCFRRHFPYGEANPNADQWEQALRYLHAHADVSEVILSGGDPLSLPDERLAVLAERLDAIPHLQRLRLHTRLPIVLPDRVDSALLDWLSRRRLRTVMVVHANHARELDATTHSALAALRAADVTLLNQSVLLRGVNDTAPALAQLSEALFAAGVMPYYLHLLDRAQGTAHFEVDETTARALMVTVREQLPGYLVPRLVRETAGATTKIPIV